MQKHSNAIAAILAVTFFVAVVGLTSLETPTGNTIQKISYLNKGKILRINVNDVPELEFVDVTAKESIKLDEIKIYSNEEIPFMGTSLSKFTISSGQPEKYSKVLLTFRIKESDLLNKRIAKEDLKLYRNGKKISLNYYKFNGGYFYFNSETQMGDFVLNH